MRASTSTNFGSSSQHRLATLGRHLQPIAVQPGRSLLRLATPQSASNQLAELPPYFNKDGFDAFRRAEMNETDVVLVSYPKCGTTWLHQILFCLLRMDDRGEFPVPPEGLVGGISQVYPDSIPAQRVGERDQKTAFSGWCVEDLLNQDSPRLFTSHIRATNLPTSLLESCGKLVVIAREPKDALVSLFFHYEKFAKGPFPKLASLVEGGMEHTFANFIEHIQNPGDGIGDYFTYYRDMAALVGQLGDRATITFYERLHEDFENEVRRLATFIGVPLSSTKLTALAQRVSFETMLATGVSSARKGMIGDHVNYLTPEHWARMDRLFRLRLADVPTLQPLAKYVS